MEETGRTKTSCQEHSSLETSIAKQKKKNQTRNQHALFNPKTNSKFSMSSSSESFINDDK
jgi:hypothetical protein